MEMSVRERPQAVERFPPQCHAPGEGLRGLWWGGGGGVMARLLQR